MKVLKSCLIHLFLMNMFLFADVSPDMLRLADEHFRSKNWAQAATEYEAITRQDPGNGQSWLRLAISMNKLGKPNDAITYFLKAESNGAAAANVKYGLAVSHGKLNRMAEALKYLVEATKMGYAGIKEMESEAAFEQLRSDAKFRHALEAAAKNAAPCKYGNEFRQFDFWLGKWDVYQNEILAGTNNIELILDECVIFENWTGLNGYKGKSFNMYNPNTKKWEQLYVDNAGTILKLEGEFNEQGLIYTGRTITADQKTILERITFQKQTNGTIHQQWDQSSDNGKTWKTLWEGVYRKP